jgi:hypothetical protein
VAGNAENWKREVRQVMSRRRRSFPSSKTVVSKKEARQVMGNVCDVKGRRSWTSGRPLFIPRNAELQLQGSQLIGELFTCAALVFTRR